jgi:hypothetical protein
LRRIPVTRLAMTISVALNAPIDHLHYGMFWTD